jgi:hypothetical protein
MVTSEDALQAAIWDLKDGTFSSIRACAKAHNVPRSTLSDRLADRDTTLALSQQRRQRLSPSQEDFLVKWIATEEYDGFPPPQARVRDMATRILRMNGDTAPLGRKWVSHFLSRNPQAASKVARPKGRAPSNADNVEDAGAYPEVPNTLLEPACLPNRRRSKRIQKKQLADGQGGCGGGTGAGQGCQSTSKQPKKPTATSSKRAGTVPVFRLFKQGRCVYEEVLL